jgi:hypothetical protein
MTVLKEFSVCVKWNSLLPFHNIPLSAKQLCNYKDRGVVIFSSFSMNWSTTTDFASNVFQRRVHGLNCSSVFPVPSLTINVAGDYLSTCRKSFGQSSAIEATPRVNSIGAD